MFVDLSQSAVLIVGTGPEAERKAEKMRPFCRAVLRSAYPPEYTEEPALVILAEKGHPDNTALSEAFQKKGIPVNVADQPELCSFRFPSVIVRGDVSVAVATGGRSPALAALLRQRLESVMPENLEEIALQAAELTTRLRQTIPDPAERAAILRAEMENWLI